MSPRETNRHAAGNILLAIYGPRTIGCAIQREAWESAGSFVRDLATVEGRFLRNNYNNECSMLPVPLFCENYVLQMTFMASNVSV
jgi:hypothetical protein